MIDNVRAAIKSAIERNPAGIKGEALAVMMGLHFSVIYRWGEAEGKKNAPLDRFIQFSLITRDYRPISALCAAVGGLFVPVPPDEGGDVNVAALRALKEFSDLLQESSRALLDDKITPPELRTILREGAEAQLALARFLAAHQAKAEADR